MPKDNINYRFTENGVVYDFYDVFVPAEYFRQPSLWIWGDNASVQLGNNNPATTDSGTPVTTFAGRTNWKSVSCGSGHVAAIKTDGTLWVWGDNSDGQLGIDVAGTTERRSTPVTTFAGGTNWKSVSCGSGHVAAIKTDGTLWVWGRNTSGQLGINNIIDKSTPVTTFAGGTNWKSVAGGYAHTLAIKTDGTLWTWGLNNSGELGTNDVIRRSAPVTTFAGGNDWKFVTGGQGTTTPYTAAIKTDGTLLVWGRNGNGQLGTNDTNNRSTPVTTFAGGTWKSVSCGEFNTAAVKTDGTLWTWGLNSYGELAINNSGIRSTPVTTFLGGTDWKSVASGGRSAAAIKTDGTLWTWGRNSSGELGANTLGTRSTPVTTTLGRVYWKSVSCGTRFVAAIAYVPDP